ncbi:MAG: hypothetical protein GXP35_15150 [Actinobacteria bacterium]|nr:hypothetical protein [Actinomycetota bacterium]
MSGRFVPRPVRPVGVSEISGWRLKRYEITVSGDAISANINLAIDRLLCVALPAPRADELGVGFLIVHHGAESVWVLADLWEGDIVSQHTFSAHLDDPTVFERVPVGGPTACVWELPVHAHERDAYVKHVLDPKSGPDGDAYLADALITNVDWSVGEPA